MQKVKIHRRPGFGGDSDETSVMYSYGLGFHNSISDSVYAPEWPSIVIQSACSSSSRARGSKCVGNAAVMLPDTQQAAVTLLGRLPQRPSLRILQMRRLVME